MKLKAVAAIAVMSILLTVFASGCDLTDLSGDSILRPPKTMGDEAEIEQLIEDTADNSFTLKYPKSGNYRSAITMTDINGDETEEAIAFYQTKSNTTSIHMLVMYDSDGSWKLSSDLTTESTDVDSVDFADINGDGVLEILVGYATYTSNISNLSAYSYADGETSVININQRYSSFCCGDMNNDGTSEILTLTLYNTDVEARATLLDYDEEQNSLYAKATVAMDPNITRYRSIELCDIDSNIKGVIVDGSLASEEINTQLIYFNSDLSLLRNSLFRDKTKNITQRSMPIVCADIDNDQIYEIPIVSALPYSGKDDAEKTADKIIWNKYNISGETLAPTVYMTVNYTYKYTIKMPEAWVANTVTAITDDSKAQMTFYEWSDDVVGEKLFEIMVFDASEWDKGLNDDYTLIYKDNNYAYTFINSNPNSEYAMTDDQIKTAFSVLDEIVI